MELPATYNANLPDVPATPDYESLTRPSLEYLENAPIWRYLKDLYTAEWTNRDETGEIPVTDLARTYLRQEPGEDDRAYANRLNDSPFDDKFAQTLRKFSNLMLTNGIEYQEIPIKIEQHLLTISNDRAPLRVFLKRLAIAALRDGHTFIYVTYPKRDPGIITEADFQRSGRRPYWVHYEALDVLRTKVDYSGTFPRITLAVLQEWHTEDSEKGEVRIPRYRILRPGSWELVEERIEKNARGQEERVFYLIESGQTTLPIVPLVPIYGGLSEGFLKSKPPLKAMADLNLSHYKLKSDHLRKIHLCCLPLLEVKDSLRDDDDDVIVSPNVVQIIRDPGGSIQWREPLATSIEQSRLEIQQLEATMDFLSASYLQNPSDRQSATASLYQAVELEASLETSAYEITQGIKEALAVHAQYCRVPDGGAIALDTDIIQNTGRDSQLLIAITNLAMRDLVSKRTLLEVLKRADYLPDDLDVNAELRSIGEQIQVKMGAGGATVPM